MKWLCPSCGLTFEVTTREEVEIMAEKYDIGPKEKSFSLPYLDQRPHHIPCNNTPLERVED